LQERAAAWFESNGEPASAVYWAVQSGDRRRVARLVARGGFAHAFVHRQDPSDLGLRDLLPLHFPEGADRAEAAESAIARSAIEAIFADTASAPGELKHVPTLKSDETLTDRDLLVTSDLTELVLGQKAFDSRAVDSAAKRLLGANGHPQPLTPGLRAAVRLAQASTHLWHGRHEDVGSLLAQALADAKREGPPGLELEVLGLMTFVDSYWTRTNHADEAAQRAHALSKRKNLGVPPSLELAAALRALVAGDLAGRARALRGILLPDVVGSDPGLAAALMLGQASVLLAEGEVNEARCMLQGLSRLPPVLAVQRDVMQADIDTSLGRPRAALRLLASYRDSEFAILTAMPCARAHLALGDLPRAQDCVRGVLAAASPQAGRFVLVDTLLCDARIALLSADPGRALEIIVRAIEIARGEIILPFLQAKDLFTDLLARHPAVAAQWPVPRQGPPEPAATSAPASSRNLPDPLTQRELTILRFLATSMSTMEIADELCLSVNTVKTHLAAIYRKLPASRRRDAVLRARELELI
jgi:LuxR family maltose regulon positive regulatory protein